MAWLWRGCGVAVGCCGVPARFSMLAFPWVPLLVPLAVYVVALIAVALIAVALPAIPASVCTPCPSLSPFTFTSTDSTP